MSSEDFAESELEEDAARFRSETPPPIQNSLFTTNLPSNHIHLDDVILKESYVLKRFSVTNRCEVPLRIQIRTDLTEQLRFQTDNENFHDQTEENFEPVQDDNFNQLFNDINLIESISLGPRSTRTLIMSFRPIPDSDSTNGSDVSDDEDKEDVDPLISHHGPTNHLNKYTEVGGYLLLSATAVQEGDSDIVEPITGTPRGNSDGRERVNSLSSMQREVQIKVTARICRSLMKVDKNHLSFEECLKGSTYVKDFTVWNCSEMPLTFSVSCSETSHLAHEIEIFDNETGLPMTGGNPNHLIPGYYHITIRVSYKPFEIGVHEMVIKIENKNDSHNVEYITLHANVLSKLQASQEYVVAPDMLDFGDCYTGIPTCQLLTLRNIAEQPVDIYFESDDSTEISFSTYTDDKQGDGGEFEEDGDTKIPPSPIKKSSRKDDPFSISPSSGGIDIPSAGSSLMSNPKVSALFPISVSPIRTFPKQPNQKLTTIEEMTINPGMERSVKIWYNPQRTQTSDQKAARLNRRRFNLSLKVKNREGHLLQQKAVNGQARACTSIVELQKTEIDLGECNIGMHKSGALEILNLSDLPAEVAIEYQSKAIQFKSKQLLIPPKQTQFASFDYNPRQANASYRKQITFVNLKNSKNDQYLEIIAHNLLQHSSGYHAQFYRLITPFYRNYIDFDNAVVNRPEIRTFTIKNTSKMELQLKLSTLLPDEIKLYEQGSENFIGQVTASPFVKRKELLIKSIEDKEILAQKRPAHQYLDLAYPPKLPSESRPVSPPADLGQLSPTNMASPPRWTSPPPTPNADIGTPLSSITWSQLLNHSGGPSGLPSYAHLITPSMSASSVSSNSSAGSTATNSPQLPHSSRANGRDLNSLVKLFNQPESIPIFADLKKEEDYVLQEVSKLEALERALAEGQLMPVSLVNLQPEGEQTIYVIFVPSGTKRPSVKGKLRKFDSKILIEMSRATQGDEVVIIKNEERVHELPVTAKICRSMMDLAQKSINFGSIQKDDHKAKVLVIHNLSEVPLIYSIRKSGSMASLDLNFSKDDRVGLIRPYRNKDIQFWFKPTLSEPYKENLMVDNIYDPNKNSQIVQVKASVLKRCTFFLKSLELDFGMCAIGEDSNVETVVISNTSSKNRNYTIQLEDYTFEFCVVDVKFFLDRDEVSEDPTLPKKGKPVDHTLIFSINPGAAHRVYVVLHPRRDFNAHRRSFNGPIKNEEGKGALLVYESKDSDASKKISFTAMALFDSGHVKAKITLGNRKSLSRDTKLFSFAATASFFSVPSGNYNEVDEFWGRHDGSSGSGPKSPKSHSPLGSLGKSRNPIFKFSKQKGAISANDTLTVEFSCVTVHAGPQHHTIIIRNLTNMLQATFSVKFTAMKPQYLRFPEIERDAEQPVLGLGKCFIDRHHENFLQNHLTHGGAPFQVFVFHDPEMTKLARE
eukprot:TRINITY_DN1416_c0_g1_i3.p1 TRINITY_DN1416_c0_g1~~TRINITY_DN1416_c0_g1_i3.p1  ORF type:complete len:1432 (-),score=329.32 TRINITY_DN1416_c0_g1_i3:312-4607(-)